MPSEALAHVRFRNPRQHPRAWAAPIQRLAFLFQGVVPFPRGLGFRVRHHENVSRGVGVQVHGHAWSRQVSVDQERGRDRAERRGQIHCHEGATRGAMTTGDGDHKRAAVVFVCWRPGLVCGPRSREVEPVRLHDAFRTTERLSFNSGLQRLAYERGRCRRGQHDST